VNLDRTITLYLSSTNQLVFIPEASFPTVRELWTLGTEEKLGWNGLYYRYGPDKLASSRILSTTCDSSNTWTWVNYGNDYFTAKDISNDNKKIYNTIEENFRILTEEQGLSPQDALSKMAMDACKSNPGQPYQSHHKKYLKMMGISPSMIKRICDNEE